MADRQFTLKTFEDLTEDARRLISEALQLGTMTLLQPDGEPSKVIVIEGKILADLVKWLATQRSKKLKIVDKPEDFQLRATKRE